MKGYKSNRSKKRSVFPCSRTLYSLKQCKRLKIHLWKLESGLREEGDRETNFLHTQTQLVADFC